MPRLADQLVQHFVTHHHLVHLPVAGQEDVMAGRPVTRALAARAGKAGAFDNGPLDPVEIAGESGAGLRLRPPLAVDRRRSERLIPFGIEATPARRNQESGGPE